MFFFVLRYSVYEKKLDMIKLLCVRVFTVLLKYEAALGGLGEGVQDIPNKPINWVKGPLVGVSMKGVNMCENHFKIAFLGLI